MRALAYLDGRYLLNQLRKILTSPGRLALWVPYVAVLVVMTFNRFATSRARPPGLSGGPHALGTAAAGAFLAMLGVTIGVAAAGRVSAFRSTAEALLFVNAGIAPLTIAVWLQIRKLLATAARWLVSILFTFLLIVPSNAGPQQLARGFVAAIAVAAAIMTAELPAFLLSRKPWGKFVAPLGWTTALVGAMYAAIGFAGSVGEYRFAPAAMAFLHLDPGAAIGAIVSSWTIPLALCCVPLLLIGSIVLLARDAVPELYAATLQAFEWRSRRSKERLVDAASSARPERIPAGALTIVWKEWIGFRRSRGGLLRWLLAFLFWLGLGAAVAWADANGERGLVLPLAGFAMTMVVLVPLAASVSLLEDLAKPIWWVSHASLRSRIVAWTFAKAWRNGLAFAAFLLPIALERGDAGAALLAVPLGLGLWASLNALGVALYAAYPSRVDARGPIFFVRALATGIFLLPAAMLFGFVSMLTHNVLAAATLGAIVIVLEGLLAIEFASMRFNENGAGISMLERA